MMVREVRGENKNENNMAMLKKPGTKKPKMEKLINNHHGLFLIQEFTA
jgi:hypothetical protein